MSEQRSLLLVPFPFSDQSGQKVRPVLVISNNEYNISGKDLIVCGITSNVKAGKYNIIIDNSDMEQGNLYSKSSIKADNILKIERKLIIKKIGQINKSALVKVLDKLYSLLKS